MRQPIKIFLAGLALLWSTYPVQICNAEGVVAEPAARADNLDISELGTAIPGSDLSLQAGRENININGFSALLSNSEQNGNLGGNILTSQLTGANSVDTGAFSNMNGIATIIQNSGNQVLIQSSTVLNLMMK